jgi:hypothetical protein
MATNPLLDLIKLPNDTVIDSPVVEKAIAIGVVAIALGAAWMLKKGSLDNVNVNVKVKVDDPTKR